MSTCTVGNRLSRARLSSVEKRPQAHITQLLFTIVQDMMQLLCENLSVILGELLKGSRSYQGRSSHHSLFLLNQKYNTFQRRQIKANTNLLLQHQLFKVLPKDHIQKLYLTLLLIISKSALFSLSSIL